MTEQLQAKRGVDVILLYRLLKNAKKNAAFKMAYQTEHSIEISRDADAQKTKDGNIQNLGQIEYDFSATSIAAIHDPNREELKQAMTSGELVEIWEIDKSEKGTSENEGKFKATYYQGYVTKYGTSPNSEDTVEVEVEFAINGIGQEGWATLTEKQAQVVQYVFKDVAIEQ